MIKTLTRNAVVMGAICLLANPVFAEDLSVRTELHRADLTGVEGMEVIVSKLVLKPGGKVPLHTHHGDEHLVVNQGSKLTTADGKTIEFKSGFATSFPRGAVHGGITNSGDKDLIVTTVHIVDKGKPIINLVK